MELVFVINPISGNGKSRRVWLQVERELQRRQVPYRALLTEYPGHAEVLAREAAESGTAKAVVAVGGDGTIHEVVNGVAEFPEVPAALIPAGSGNDFHRVFSQGLKPLDVLERILTGTEETVRRADLGSYRLGAGREGRFMNGIGIGFDGDIAKVTNESSYKKWFNWLRIGMAAYVLTVFRLLFSYRTQDVRMVVDGEEHRFERVWLIAVSNIAYYGGGMKINPDAVPDDGKFHICVVHNLSRAKLFAVFGTVFAGTHTRFREVTVLTGRQIEVSSEQPMTIHADGEIIGTTPVAVDITPLARTLL